MTDMGVHYNEDLEWDRLSSASTLTLLSTSEDGQGNPPNPQGDLPSGQETNTERVLSNAPDPRLDAEQHTPRMMVAEDILEAASVSSESEEPDDINEADDRQDDNEDVDSSAYEEIDAASELSSASRDVSNDGIGDSLVLVPLSLSGKPATGGVPLDFGAFAPVSTAMSFAKLHFLLEKPTRELVPEHDSVIPPSPGEEPRMDEHSKTQNANHAESSAKYCLGCGDEHGELVARWEPSQSEETNTAVRGREAVSHLPQYVEVDVIRFNGTYWRTAAKHALELKARDLEIENLRESKKKLDDIREEKIEVVRRNYDLKKQLDIMGSEQERLDHELCSVQARLKEANDLADQRHIRVKELSEDRTALINYRHGLLKELTRTKERVLELEQSITDPDVVAQLKQSNDDLSNVINDRNKQIDWLVEQYNFANSERVKRVTVAKENEDLQAECANWKSKAAIAEEKHKQTARAHAKLTEKLENVHAVREQAEAEVKTQRRQIIYLNDRVCHVERCLDAAKENEKQLQAKKSADENLLHDHYRKVIAKSLQNTVDAMTFCYNKFDEYMKLSRTHSDAVAHLRSELVAAREMQDCMDKDIACGVEQIRTLEQQVKDRDEILFEAESTNSHPTREKKLERELDELRQDLAIKDNIITTLQEEAVKLRERHEEHAAFNLLESMPGLHKLLHSLGHLQDIISPRMNLQHQCRVINRAAEELHDDCIKLGHNLTDAMGELSDTKAKMDEQKKEFDRAKTAVENRANEARYHMDLAKKHSDATQTRIEGYGQALLGAWEEMNKLRQQLENLETSKESDSEKYKSLSASHKDLHTKYENISIERDSLDASFKALHAQYEDLSNRGQMPQQKRGVEIMLSQLRHRQQVDASIKRAQLVKLEKKRQDAVKQLKDRENSLVDQRMILEEYEHRMDRLDDLATERAKEIEQLKVRLANANERLLTLLQGGGTSAQNAAAAAAKQNAPSIAPNIIMGATARQRTKQPKSPFPLPPYGEYQTFHAVKQDGPGTSMTATRTLPQKQHSTLIPEPDMGPSFADLALHQDLYDQGLKPRFESRDALKQRKTEEEG